VKWTAPSRERGGGGGGGGGGDDATASAGRMTADKNQALRQSFHGRLIATPPRRAVIVIE